MKTSTEIGSIARLVGEKRQLNWWERQGLTLGIFPSVVSEAGIGGKRSFVIFPIRSEKANI